MGGIVGLLERIYQGDGGESLLLPSVIQSLHCSKFHRLHLCHHIGRVVAGVECEQRGYKTYRRTDFYALGCQFDVSLLEQIPAAYGKDEDGTNNPRRDYGVAELVDGKWRKSHFGKRRHLIAHGVGIECAAHGILHP